MDEIVLIGAGGHAKACIDVIEQENKYRIVGLVEKDKSKSEGILNYPIVGVDTDLQKIRESVRFALVTIGQIKNPNSRVAAFELLHSFRFQLPVIRSPLAYVSSHAKIGIGTIIMHGAIVNSGTEIGRNCIVNSNALVEHDSKIGNHCHIATGAIVNGEVQVGEGSFIGSGSVIREKVSIGARCIISAGCFVKLDVTDNQVEKN